MSAIESREWSSLGKGAVKRATLTTAASVPFGQLDAERLGKLPHVQLHGITFMTAREGRATKGPSNVPAHPWFQRSMVSGLVLLWSPSSVIADPYALAPATTSGYS